MCFEQKEKTEVPTYDGICENSGMISTVTTSYCYKTIHASAVLRGSIEKVVVPLV